MTDIELEKIKDIHPMKAKELLAWTITKTYHSEDEADKARDGFIRVFSERLEPEKIEEYKIDSPINISFLIFQSGLAKSRSEAITLIKQGGVSLDNEKIDNPDFSISPPKSPILLRVGKRRFLRLV